MAEKGELSSWLALNQLLWLERKKRQFELSHHLIANDINNIEGLKFNSLISYNKGAPWWKYSWK